ncbi:DUF4362 domain-containing protein [Paenibacillus sp. GCM10027628]|uniref:DUF4362 domain-containing protein n=1 Tax=Paenibacillus sp. GCM10027628 TaxID=3273413 RepID=UPI00362A96DD
MLKKLMIFAFAVSLISGCQNIQTLGSPKGKEIKNNADVVDIHGNVSNLYKMDDFVKSVNAKENASIRISHYTIEGDPIYHNIKFKGGKFEIQYDTTQDNFGPKNVTTYTCEKLDKTETNTELKYSLNGCSTDSKSVDVLYISYDVSQQDLFQFQLKYGDNQANEINTIDMKLVKDLKNGQMLGVSDFQLNKEEQQQIYKKMVLSNFLSEKKFAVCKNKPSYYLKVKINGAVREYNWSDCFNGDDNKIMTDLAKTIIEVVNANQSYATPNRTIITNLFINQNLRTSAFFLRAKPASIQL